MTDRDLVIEALAVSEAALIDQVVDLTIERDAYRLVSHQAIHRSHEQHVELERLRTMNARLIDEVRAANAELRRYTVSVVGGERAA